MRIVKSLRQGLNRGRGNDDEPVSGFHWAA